MGMSVEKCNGREEKYPIPGPFVLLRIIASKTILLQ
jgi:hypothetical protein